MLQKISIIFLCILMIGCSALKKDNKDVYQNLTVNEIYERGKINIEKKKYTQAISDFEALEARFPFSEHAQKGMMALTYCYYANDDKGSALATADRFIKTNPLHQNIDYIYYIKGLVYYKDNYSKVYQYFPLNRSMRDSKIAKEAFEQFRILLEKYPHSKYAHDARLRMIHLRDQLAEHELCIARYYFKKCAYIAAANRASFILMEYDQSKFVPEALSILKTSYEKLNMPELVKKVDVIKNYNSIG